MVKKLEAFGHISMMQTDEETYDFEHPAMGSVVARFAIGRCGLCGACNRAVVPVDGGNWPADDVELNVVISEEGK